MIRCMIVAAAILAAGCVTNASQPVSSTSATASDAQSIAHIRDLEERERQAVLAGDVAAIEAFWDPQFLVNAPNNRLLVGRDATLDLVRSGVIQFSRFDRVIERVEVDGDVAVTMGSETIVQQRGPQAGQVIQAALHQHLALEGRAVGGSVPPRQRRPAPAANIGAATPVE